MTSHHSDILLPRAAWDAPTDRSRLIAFVPIVVALLGVTAILIGGLSVKGIGGHDAALTNVDPMTTGSIITGDQQRALQMLDH